MREFTKLIIKVQSNTRKFLAIKLLKSLKYEKKVMIVQRQIRKYIRCKKKKLEKQLVIIQTQLRKYIFKKRIKKLYLVRNVIIIQSLFKRYFLISNLIKYKINIFINIIFFSKDI